MTDAVSCLANCLGAASVVIYACLLTGACGRKLIAQWGEEVPIHVHEVPVSFTLQAVAVRNEVISGRVVIIINGQTP